VNQCFEIVLEMLVHLQFNHFTGLLAQECLPKQFVCSHSSARNRNRVTFKRKAATNTTRENERIHSIGILNAYTHKN
jgi:hypothetical protein